MAALLELDGLSKSFFGVKALKGVTLSVEEGSVLGLVGENGAGKSTLMNLIGGIHAPTEGAMRMDGHAYAPRTAADAKAAGIAFIHQELNLFTNLSIAENVFIDGFPKRFGLIDRRAARTRTAELLGALDLDQSPDARVESLSPGERQLVEIAKALHRDARLIILDEPTTSLTARETVRLFETMDRLRARGVTMIYISHVLADVARLSTHVAVLRDGALVTTGTADAFDVPTMIQAMIGRELTQLFPPRTCAPGADIVLSVEKVSQPGVVKDVSLEVRRGEILGLFGLMGSGRSELARILFGLDDRAAGRIAVNGSELTDHGPTEAIAAGMAFVTENRREEGLLMEAPIAENMTLVSLSDYARTPFALLDRGRMRPAVAGAARDLSLRAGDDLETQPAKSLSGGNQQKVVLAKWLLSQPGLFILDEPTRGVDVGAKYEIYTITDRLAAEGNGILVISSEVEELMGLCDRILVMSHGEIVASFVRPDPVGEARGTFDQEEILRAAFRETQSEAEAA